jgi:hypothetical protein
MKKLIVVSALLAAVLANVALAQQGAISVLTPNGTPVVVRFLSAGD